MNNTSYDYGYLFILTLVIIVIILFFISVVIPFCNQRKYIKTEIARSTGREKKYWKKELRKLWLSLLPFSNYFINND